MNTIPSIRDQYNLKNDDQRSTSLKNNWSGNSCLSTVVKLPISQQCLTFSITAAFLPPKVNETKTVECINRQISSNCERGTRLHGRFSFLQPRTEPFKLLRINVHPAIHPAQQADGGQI